MATIKVTAILGNLPVVTQFIEEQLESADCPMKAMMQIDTASDEIYSNISYYAYPKETPGDAIISVEIGKNGNEALITFEDMGMAFNPLVDAGEPDTSLPAEERAAGGLGIFLVRKLMDEVTYKRENGKNILQLRKTW
jgi:anti-sigma regulatory factor (Ser/Thr protein kinase)